MFIKMDINKLQVTNWNDATRKINALIDCNNQCKFVIYY